MEKKEMYTREEVIDELKKMQIETAQTVGFVAGMVSQLWVINDLLKTRINDLGGEGIEVKII